MRILVIKAFGVIEEVPLTKYVNVVGVEVERTASELTGTNLLAVWRQVI